MKKNGSLSYLLIIFLILVIIPLTFYPNQELGEKKRSNINIDYELSSKGDLTVELTDFRVPKIQSAPTSLNPITGNVSFLVMPIAFTDKTNQLDIEEMEELWNSPHDSIQAYYLANSYGTFNITATILDWVDIDQSSTEFYGEDISAWSAEQYLFGFLADNWDSTIDFDDYDYVVVVMAGKNDYDSGYWPHAWPPDANPQAGFETNEKIFNTISFIPEMSDTSHRNEIGTYCHELGHNLGLLDYYVTQSFTYPVGYWELMGAGPYNGNPSGTQPAQLSLYSRMEIGWVTEDQIYSLEEGEITNLKITPIESSYTNPDEGYYHGAYIDASDRIKYYIEYRADIDTDHYLPDHGLLVSRLDTELGQLEGPFYYIGGNNMNPNLANPELQATNTENDENFVHWLTGNFEFSVSVIEEHPEQGEVPNNLEVILDTFTDLGEDWLVAEEILHNEEAYWDLPNMKVEDLIYFLWDTENELSGSDFSFLKETAPNVYSTILTISDIYQDAILLQINETGNYRIEIFNDNAENSIDIQFHLIYYPAAKYEISANVPTTSYLVDGVTEFNIDITLFNQNKGWTAWEDVVPGVFNLEFDDNFTFIEDNGDNFMDLSTPIFYNHPLSHNWRFNATELGAYNISITYSDVNITYEQNFTIQIAEDVIPPEFSLNTLNNITNLVDYTVFWNAVDPQTGMHHYDFYLDGVFIEQLISSSKSVWSITIPNVEGIYNLTVIAYDTVNNSAIDSMLIRYDNTDPEMTRIEGNLEDEQYWLVFDMMEETTESVNVRIYLDDDKIHDIWIHEDEFIDYLIEITSEHLQNYESKDLPSITLKIQIYDEAGNSKSYYHNFGDIFGLSEKKVAGFNGILIITGIATVFIISYQKFRLNKLKSQS